MGIWLQMVVMAAMAWAVRRAAPLHLCVYHLKGKQGQNVDCWGLATLIQSCLRHSSRGDLDATAGSIWPRPKPRDVCTLQISRRFGTKNGRRRQHQALKPVKPAKSLCEAAISIVLLLVGKGNACVHRALLP